jgi:HSP20 family protein
MADQDYSIGDFQRDFHLGSLIDPGKIEATMKDGVLRLVMPKWSKPNPGRSK